MEQNLDFTMKFDGITEDKKSHVNDFVWGNYKYKYDVDATYFDSELSYYFWTERECSDEELSSMKDEIERYIRYVPGAISE